MGLGIVWMTEELILYTNDNAEKIYGLVSCVCLCVVSLFLLGSIIVFLIVAKKFKEDIALRKDAQTFKIFFIIFAISYFVRTFV